MLGKNDTNKITQIPINKIRPAKYQPRRVFNENELSSLAESITHNGILQPLTVREVNKNEYELIAGERRLRAAQWAGLSKVPCIINNCTDNKAAIYSLIENIQRSNLNPFEEAEGIKRLMVELSLTQEQVAMRLGKKQSTIANKLRLLRISEDERNWIIKEGLSERHARALLIIDDVALRKNILSRVIINKLNVTQTEELIRQVLTDDSFLSKSKKKNITKTPVIKDVRIFMNTINKALDTMKRSGIEANAEKVETDDYIEYSLRIPKKRA
ncbi:MAG: ParB/RepB/Spo0J family partition protein [Clostridia bacterium]|nr:ParB/RepB/Spo0J family partition protein [Clostridia bacterium]